MTRKLLPYEYDLIQQLGVTEDEYLDFIEVQFNYELAQQSASTDANCYRLQAAVAGSYFRANANCCCGAIASASYSK
jgi:hypothetical protein